MSIALQNVIVTVAAVAAAAVFVRRLIGSRQGAKPSCPSCDAGCAPSSETTRPEVRPLVLVTPRSKGPKVQKP